MVRRASESADVHVSVRFRLLDGRTEGGRDGRDGPCLPFPIFPLLRWSKREGRRMRRTDDGRTGGRKGEHRE